MRRWLLPLLALPLLAASPPRRQAAIPVPPGGDPLAPFILAPTPRTPAPTFAPAPTPNRDIDAPRGRGTNEPSFSATLFTRKDQYRGEGFTGGMASTAQSEQERRVTPGAGLSLRMPLTPQ